MVLQSVFISAITLLVSATLVEFSAAQNNTAPAPNATVAVTAAATVGPSGNQSSSSSQTSGQVTGQGFTVIPTNTPCTNNTECTLQYDNSECYFTGTEVLCACPPNYAWKNDTNMCLLQALYGDPCKETIECTETDQNSVCADDGSNGGTKRCQCAVSFKAFTDANTTKCVQILTSDKVPDCKVCEDNDGTCISVNNNGVKSNCVCPVSRIGDNCQTILVNVSCDSENFQMIICYSPQHPGVNFTAGSDMYPVGKGVDEACKGSVVENITNSEDECEIGDVRLVLDLVEGRKERCGTNVVQEGSDSKKYYNKIQVNKVPVVPGSVPEIFTTYCTYKVQDNLLSAGVGVNAVPGNDRGETKEPDLDMKVIDITGREVVPGVQLRIDDLIRFIITLEKDGTYESILVDRCTTSSSAIIPDPNAVTISLTTGSCPVSGQNIFTASNNWIRQANQSNVVTTGNVKLWKLSKGNTVFLHCTVKLCLKGKPTDCLPITCPGQSVGRKKRATDDSQEVTISAQISVQDESLQVGSMGQSEFAVMVTVTTVLLVVFIVLGVLLYLRYRRRRAPKIEALQPRKPTQFAMPRLNNPHMRM